MDHITDAENEKPGPSKQTNDETSKDEQNVTASTNVNRKNHVQMAQGNSQVNLISWRQNFNETQHYRRKGRGRGRSSNCNLFNTRNARPGYSGRNRLANEKGIGFLFLVNCSKLESNEIIGSINEKKNEFLELLQSPIENPDVFVLLMKILSILCTSPFEQLKSNLILSVCNSSFVNNLRLYLTDLPYLEEHSSNKMYWENQEDFWTNFVSFCEYVVKTLPTIARNKLRMLIDSTSKCSLEGLNEKHGFILCQDQMSKLSHLRESLLIPENETVAKQNEARSKQENISPPNNFRLISILPNQNDLLCGPPFLRPNIVQGGYSDIEHYLDVQFRLLREDCIGPLREGICQYLEEPTKKKFDHVRVFQNVQFIQPYISKEKTGVLVQMDEKTTKRFNYINWKHKKRFIYGSLVLFTNDHFKTIIVATVLDHNPEYLKRGQIPVSVVNKSIESSIYKRNQYYLMIESGIYFEPYYHVLKALQHPSFAEHIAMSKYIVNVDLDLEHPRYLKEDSVFKVEMDSGEMCKFKVLERETWPSCQEMGLNESQYEAYQLALTHEFAVIQGPPGTGKTYLGVKVAKALLQNISLRRQKCVLLIICYTNHALDQFLNAISTFTSSIVRIGGQSRNEEMQKFNLNNLRRNCPIRDSNINKLFLQERYNLKVAISELQRSYDKLEIVTNGVLSYDVIRSFIDESYIIGKYYEVEKERDPLKCWLFDDREAYLDQKLIIKIINDNFENAVDNNSEISKRNDVIFDDLFEGLVDNEKISFVFLLSSAEKELRDTAVNFAKSQNNNEKQSLMSRMQLLSSEINMFKTMWTLRDQHKELNIPLKHPSRYSTKDRWRIYFGWAKRVQEELMTNVIELQKNVERVNVAYEETRMMTDLEIIRDHKVIGLTTSGAARLRKLLQSLGPPIVIVEEAAEVLEQHIVTSLTKHCQHLILIGDHQQLRPSSAHVKLAKHFNTEVSLFERMIVNKVHSRQLSVQHRMRPEIASLISPHIYTELKNHPSVEAFPEVLGMCNNLFFFTHNYKEEEVDDSTTKVNYIEADLVLGLANYLMQQGYQPEEVTILATYTGQMFYMQKERNKYIHLNNMKITVVDNYQGEESKIILLSLVRNNDREDVGFLKSVNRVCVAMSRAKEGFYIFGNINMLKNNSDLWKKIADTLQNNGSLGTTLNLRCQVHSDNITNISCLEDFQKVPEGGCLLKCLYTFDCGHHCPRLCHSYDLNHTFGCQRKCERVICELDHVCPLQCREQCKPCKVLVEKDLPCGHRMNVMCAMEPTDTAVWCTANVTVTLPKCGHEATKMCHMDTKYVRCPAPCNLRLDCGHVCISSCHVANDPDHEKYTCNKPCTKAKNGCTAQLGEERGEHHCARTCHETCENCEVMVEKKRANCRHIERIACNKDVNEFPCKKNCARLMPCGHYCKKKCYEDCGETCNEMVNKRIEECGHVAKVACSCVASRECCGEACARTLPCGHACGARCAAECAPAACAQPLPARFAAPCGHRVALPCGLVATAPDGIPKQETLLVHCTAPCNQTLACGHICQGTCSQCLQGRLHVACKQKCNQTNICGHVCEEPCNQVCPPCRKPCEVRCQHSRCPKLCGEPCVPCQEACSRRCEHGQCAARCGAACSRAPCSQPCPRARPCGHRCRGLCGEPCPDICDRCRPDRFPTDFLGDSFGPDDKFVMLEDCNHVLEVENMDNLMFGDKETISIRACPYCRKPIINTHRYKDFIGDMLKKEINPIKMRVYGTKEQIVKKNEELRKKIEEMSIILIKADVKDNISSIKNWALAFRKLSKISKIQRISLLQLEMQFTNLNILELLANLYNHYTTKKLLELKDKIIHIISVICNIVIINTHKISQQQQQDIRNEIKRINYIVEYAEVMSYVSPTEEIRADKEKVISEIDSWTIFDENKAKESLENFKKKVKLSVIIAKQERDLIVKAIGLKAGHWYKCPNNHFYCIGECGGATVVSKCIECGAPVGGTRHALLPTNSLAPEMDNAQFPAWSEHYNNMNNFDIH